MWRPELGCSPAPIPTGSCASPNGVFGVALLSRRPFARRRAALRPPRRIGIARSISAARPVDVARDPPQLAVAVRAVVADRRAVAATSPSLARRRSWRATATPRGALRWRGIASAGDLSRSSSAGPTWLEIKLPMTSCVSRAADRPDVRQGRCHHPFGAAMEETGSDHLPVMVEFCAAVGCPQRAESRQGGGFEPPATRANSEGQLQDFHSGNRRPRASGGAASASAIGLHAGLASRRQARRQPACRSWNGARRRLSASQASDQLSTWPPARCSRASNGNLRCSYSA